MRHLTPKEIVDYISISEITPSTLSLASKVNTHIRACESCLTKVQAFQIVKEALERGNQSAEIEVLAAEVRKRSSESLLVDLDKE